MPVYPRQGEVYLINPLRQIADTKKRPAIVISSDVLNRHRNNILVVPLTSDLSASNLPTRVFIKSPDGGIEKDSLAVCENLSATKKVNLSDRPFGIVSSATLLKIRTAIAVVIS